MERNYNSLVETGTWMKVYNIEVKLATVICRVRFDNEKEDSQYLVEAQGFLI